ncbi:MAG: MopE-related protein [Bacteroidota bacterium]
MKRLGIVFLLIISVITTEEIRAQHTVAREWNEVLLTAIRNDFARPTVHARNLFHTSVAMYDMWAVYDDEARPYFLGQTVGGYTCPFDGIIMPSDIEAAREEAISYAAYRLLEHRFFNSPGASVSLPLFFSTMTDLGYDPLFTSTDYSNGSPAALGNYLAQHLIQYGLQDGANEVNDYANQHYQPVNTPLVVEFDGNPTITDYNRWQPLTLSVFIDQSGNVFPGATPGFLSPEWGQVTPFALETDDLTVFERDGNDYLVYHDPGPPALLDVTGTEDSQEYMWNFSLVATWSSHMSPDDGVLWDISPNNIGNIPVEAFPTTFAEYQAFYDIANGGDPSQGHTLNPATGEPYPQQLVARGDYARILAEFWADGPDSETPPGHWFTILNYVTDHPEFVPQFNGAGEVLDPLEWEVKAYLTLGGTLHDVAVSVWGIKGWYDYLRPVSAIRAMADLGQSTSAALPSYHPAGIPLLDGFIALVSAGDPLAGFAGQNIGKIKLRAWRGPDYVTIPEIQEAGVGWILADDWWPYQRPSFVSPNFAGYISGHSTFSRAAAEVMTAITGDAFFPGGVGEFVAPEDEFLVFEDGPSEDITLQWATYRDASDQCSLSRIWGGIHPPIDDIPGRRIGIEIGTDGFVKARSLFYNDADGDGFFSYEDCDDSNASVYPGAPEVCDGLDNNCDQAVDEGVLLTFYADADADGFGDANVTTLACSAPSNFVSDNTDCNDADANEYPGQEWFYDLDGDGYGDGSSIINCERLSSTYLAGELTATTGDCNDNDATISPAAVESCDGIDNNCDGQIDEDLPLFTYYADADGDGFGNLSVSLDTCNMTPPAGYVANFDDCDDTSAADNPDAEERCDGVDNDCDGQVDEDLEVFRYFADADGDGFGNGAIAIDTCQTVAPLGFVVDDTDCDDTNAAVYPQAPELADNGIDEDCSGLDLFEQTKVFPNPVSEMLTVHKVYEGPIQAKIFDVRGRLVWRQTVVVLANRFTVDVAHLDRGVYYLRLGEGEDKEEDFLVERFVKM